MLRGDQNRTVPGRGSWLARYVHRRSSGKRIERYNILSPTDTFDCTRCSSEWNKLQNRISNVDTIPSSTSGETGRGSSDHIHQWLVNDNPVRNNEGDAAAHLPTSSPEDRRTRANQLFRNGRSTLRNMMISINNVS